jgi:hypothetical protein
MRSKPFSVSVVATLIVAAVVLPSARLAAEERAPIESWISADVVGYGVARGAGRHVKDLLASDLYAKFQASPIGKLALESPKIREFLGHIETVRREDGVDALELADALFGREVAIGVRLTFEGPEIVVVSQTESAESITRALEAVKKVVTKRHGAWPIGILDSKDGVEILGADNIAYARIGATLIASNNARGVRRAIDVSSGKEGTSLLTAAAFATAVKRLGADVVAGVAVRPQFLPDYRIPERLENIVASLIASPWNEALRRSSLLSIALRRESDGPSLDVSAEIDEPAFRRDLAAFFPPVGSSTLWDAIARRGTLGVYQIHRDLDKVWSAAEQFVDSKGIGELRQASVVLSIVFGRAFEEEVLPELLPTMTLVTESQKYAELGKRPMPAIPGFALIFEMKDPDRFGRSLRSAFQSIVGIINADRASKKKDGGMLLVEPKTVGKETIYAVTQVDARTVGEQPGIEFNFTPALAIVGKHVVLSSSVELCESLVGDLASVTAEAPASDTTVREVTGSDRLRIDAPRLRTVFEENLDALIAQQMLEKGKSRAEAESELRAILAVFDWVRDLELESGLDDGALRLRLDLGLAGAKAADSAAKSKEGSKASRPGRRL